jgi:hypothetical protein
LTHSFDPYFPIPAHKNPWYPFTDQAGNLIRDAVRPAGKLIGSYGINPVLPLLTAKKNGFITGPHNFWDIRQIREGLPVTKVRPYPMPVPAGNSSTFTKELFKVIELRSGTS